MNTLKHKGYIGSVQFSEDAGVFKGKIEGIDSLVTFEGSSIKELTDNFQKAEFLLEKGFIDLIVDRRNLREKLYKILAMHEVKAYE